MQYDFENLKRLTDEKLIRLVQNRDEAAFSELMSRYSPRIWRVVIANSRQRRDAEEILMDVWMAVWENIDGLRKIDSFGGWLRRIAYNACTRYYASNRRAQRETAESAPELVAHIDVNAASRFREAQLHADIREAVQHLPQRVRPTAVLYYLESWSIKEIAEELDLAIGTVKTKLRETRELLRKEFDMAPKKGETMSSESVHLNKPNVSEDACYIPAMDQTESNRDAALWGLPEDARARFGRGAINAMALSPDGKHLALGTDIGLWWYEVANLSPIALWRTDCERISAIAFSASGEWIATGHEDGSVKVWDVRQANCFTQVERQAHRLCKKINQLIFSPDSKHLAANGHFDYMVDVWNPETGVQLAKFGDAELRFQACWEKHPISFSQDSQLIVCASPPDDAERLKADFWSISPERDVISVWDVANGKRVAYLTEYTEFLYALSFSPCGNFLAASSDGEAVPTLTVWDTENWQVEKEERIYGGNQLIPTYSTTGEMQVVAVSDTDVTVWDTTCHEKLNTYHTPDGGETRRWSLSGNQFALATTHELNVWTIGDPDPRAVSYNSHPDYLLSLAFLADGETLVTEYPFPEGTFRCWDVVTRSQTPSIFKLPGEKHCLYTSTSGQLHTSSVEGNSIKVREFGNDTPTAECGIKERPRYLAVAFSDTAQLIAYGDSEKNLYVWDIAREEIINTFTVPESNVAFITFSPNGKYLASGHEMGCYRLWDLACGEEIHAFHSHQIEHIAFSPCGNVIAGEMEKAFIFWDIESAKTLLTIPKPEGYAYWWQGGIVFSPCGLYLATGLDRVEGMASAPIKLWNTTTGENVTTFEGHLTLIHSLTFSPDGTLLASAGYDGTILFWDTKSVVNSY